MRVEILECLRPIILQIVRKKNVNAFITPFTERNRTIFYTEREKLWNNGTCGWSFRCVLVSDYTVLRLTTRWEILGPHLVLQVLKGMLEKLTCWSLWGLTNSSSLSSGSLPLECMGRKMTWKRTKNLTAQMLCVTVLKKPHTAPCSFDVTPFPFFFFWRRQC